MRKLLQILTTILFTSSLAFAGGPSFETTWNPTNIFEKVYNGADYNYTVNYTASREYNFTTTESTLVEINYSTTSITSLVINNNSFVVSVNNVVTTTSSIVGYSLNLANSTFTGTVSGTFKLANINNLYFSGTLPFTFVIENLSLSNVSVLGISTNGNVTSITSPVNITINGSGFASGATATINGVSVSVVSTSANRIVVSLPAGVITSTSANVIVKNIGQFASTAFTVTPTSISPTVTSFVFQEKSTNSGFKIFPNPVTNGEFNVENAELGTNLIIYNSQGLVVYSQKIVSETTSVKTTLLKGIYLVKVDKEVSKFIVE